MPFSDNHRFQLGSILTELSCKIGIYKERGPKGPDF